MITLSQGAHEWSSVHRPIEFTYDYQSRNIVSITNDGGYAKVIVNAVYTDTPLVGNWLSLNSTLSGAYDGNHKIKIVNSTTSFTLETPYTTGSTLTGSSKFIYLPEVKIYAGYDTGETYDTELPSFLVATFTPRNSPSNNVKIDVSGYLKGIFEITPPSDGIDFTSWNRFRLFIDGDYSPDYYVINSAIEQEDLNKYYVKTGRFLTDYDAFKGLPLNRQFVQSCGITLMQRIQGNQIVGYLFEDGDTSDTDTGGTGGIGL